MNISIISSSQRPNSNSIKIGTHIQNQISKNLSVKHCSIIDLAVKDLPLWGTQSSGEENINCSNDWQAISHDLIKSDSFIFIVPEWGGMVPATLKNLFLYAGSKELAHKPALIISVSAGLGGSYPISELRSSSYKNNRICFLPEHLIIRHADEFFDQESKDYDYMHNRLHHCLKLLMVYSNAFTSIRLNQEFDFKKYPNGM